MLCVLIGKETYTRRWVDYGILKAVEYGMRVFGIRIHQLKDPKQGVDTPGSSPFQFLGYGTKDGKLNPIHYQSGWKDAPYRVLRAVLRVSMRVTPLESQQLSATRWARNPAPV